MSRDMIGWYWQRRLKRAFSNAVISTEEHTQSRDIDEDQGRTVYASMFNRYMRMRE